MPVTIENDRQTALAIANEQVRVGALEKYLTDRGQLGSVANINNLDDNLDSTSMLEILMFRMGDKDTTSSKHGGGAGSMKVQFTNPDITGSSEERARRLTIRGDAEIVFDNDNLRAQLNSLHDFAGDPAALYSAVKSTGNIHLKRAITSNEDIDKALSGEHTTSNHTHACPACPAQNQQQTVLNFGPVLVVLLLAHSAKLQPSLGVAIARSQRVHIRVTYISESSSEITLRGRLFDP